MSDLPLSSAGDIAAGVSAGHFSAREVVNMFLARIARMNPALNAFTAVLAERATARAAHIDAQLARGKKPGRLAGVPFAVKNLFDICGLPTLAGSAINADHAPARDDALLIRRLEAEGAILIGALGMGEYAYDFTGENAHYGNCANPWDTARMSGGSSSGSGSALGGTLVPLALGSDTNGSIRVPASFCGIFGLKPTYGRLPRSGTYPFSDSLDHLGPMARTSRDLALAFDVMQGYSNSDHACADRPALDCIGALERGLENLRIRRAGGYFSLESYPPAARAVDKVCRALNCTSEVEIPGTQEGRCAAYLITNVEGSRLHLPRLRTRPQDFDPDTRDRFIAGALLPASWYARAQQVRHWYARKAAEVFRDVDVIVAAATPCVAPRMGEKILTIQGEAQPLRANLGYFTQPISAAGLPSCVVPTLDEESGLPIGVQIIAAPWREDLCLRVAFALETRGFTAREPDALGKELAAV
ncbi:AtzE family amidohydrolase [Microbulbifer harenosus]|uniref:AtzE family amidohydrolase n=1 Tax=Microbulbifer harenosus TaxID=2576840 RepID=UPI001FE272A2|nr:AtzE family amidohydrolase [Microbulbifer harenosus]